MKLSVVLPAFNEEENLVPLVEEALAVLPAQVDQFEIIVVDDGSRDATAAVAEELALRDERVRVHHHHVNHGYGAALRSGFTAARYEWLFFTDSDRQFRLEDLERLLPQTTEHDIVTGYRENRRDPIHRRLYARLWNGLGRLLFGFAVRDVNCAFKLMRREVIAAMPLLSTGALINTEIFARARRQQLAVAEVPVRHYPRPAGQQTGGRPTVILRAFVELVRLRLQMGRQGRRRR